MGVCCMEKKIVKTIDGKTFGQKIAERMVDEREQRKFNERLNSGKSGLKRKKTQL